MTGQTVVLWLSFLVLGGVQGLHAEPQVSTTPPKAGGSAVNHSSRAMVLQKLQLVKMMLSTSKAIERASRSDDAAIKQQVAAALARYASANDALNADNPARAEELADEALHLIEDLSRLTPDPQQAEAGQRTRYEELLKELRSAEATYQDLRHRMASTGKAPAGLEHARKLSDQAQALARDGRYREAGELLKDAHAEIISALNKLLGSTTLMYELKFKSAVEEYDYELARYHSYEELAPIAYVELKPDKDTIKLSERYVQESRAMRDTAKQQAEQGDHQAAIKTLLEAIKRMQTALRVVGLVLQE